MCCVCLGHVYDEDANNHSVRAIIGRISQSHLSYLVTAGTDRSIRFWDFASPSRCFTVCGLDPAQPKGIYDAPKMHSGSSSSTTTNTMMNSNNNSNSNRIRASSGDYTASSSNNSGSSKANMTSANATTTLNRHASVNMTSSSSSIYATATTNKLFVCYVASTPSPDKMVHTQLPAREGRGIVTPNANNKV